MENNVRSIGLTSVNSAPSPVKMRNPLIGVFFEEVLGLLELKVHRRWDKLFQVPREVGFDLL
jgi:hypothetical protein